MTVASIDTSALLDTVERLIDVLDSEVDLLSAMKASDIGRFQPTKSMLIDSYERMAAELRADEAGLVALDPEQRRSMCEAMARLTHSCRRNEMALRAVMTANERLMRAIVEAHGGSVDVESRLNAGSTFTVSLPAGGSEL